VVDKCVEHGPSVLRMWAFSCSAWDLVRMTLGFLKRALSTGVCVEVIAF
jgi:hypothetical protein